MAPGGFGKTTLLAEACRRAVADGVSVAWITLAVDDDAAALDACLAFAFDAAGLDLAGQLDSGESGVGDPYPRTALLLRVLVESGHPWVLALDELENATHPTAVALLNHLLSRVPPNVHIAIACRKLPRGLDASRAVLGGPAEIVTAEDLRFSRPDIARFFDLALSRDDLAAIATESAGWPIALTIRRNDTGTRHLAEARVARHVADNWIAGRFWEGFAEADRVRILDIGLMDWLDADLLDEILESPGVLARLVALPGLDGLLEPVGLATAGVYRLHPLLREHCAERLRVENPTRHHRIHRRLATALARRGAVVEAMRHARLAGDAALAGRILVEAGSLQWCLVEGAERFDAADRLLTDEVAATQAVAMTRCVALLMRGRQHEARRTFAAALTVSGEPAPEVDVLLAIGAMDMCGCQPFDAVEASVLAPRVERLLALPATPGVVRAAMAHGLSVRAARRAEFDTATAHARRAMQAAKGRSAYLTMAIETQQGEIAMARGDVREARKRYRGAQRLARQRFLEDPRGGAYADMLLLELALERNRVPDGTDTRHVLSEPCRGDAPLSHFAAAVDIAADLTLEASGPEAALTVIETLSERAHQVGLLALDGHFAAHRVALLVADGRVDEAEQTWQVAELPDNDADCLAFTDHGWRLAEVLGYARVRLHAARGDLDAAGRLARAIADAAAQRNLRRTLMRAVGLRIGLCRTAAERDDAVFEYLSLYLRTDYARPFVHLGNTAWQSLERIVDALSDGALADAGERLLAMARDGVGGTPRLTSREKAVLRLLDREPDKRIAVLMGLSVRGVRYRIECIFNKLGVRRRADAVHRARALGVLPAAD